MSNGTLKRWKKNDKWKIDGVIVGHYVCGNGFFASLPASRASEVGPPVGESLPKVHQT